MDITLLIPPEVTDRHGPILRLLLPPLSLSVLPKGDLGEGSVCFRSRLCFWFSPAKTILPLLLPILIACDIFTIRSFPHTWDKEGFWLIAPGMVAGLFAGIFCLNRMRVEDFNLIIGILSIVFCIMMWMGVGNRPLFTRASLAKGTVVGLACGISTMVAHSAGAIVNMFLLSRRLDKTTFIGTTGRFYFTFNVLKIPFFYWNPDPDGPTFGLQTLLWASWALPLCPLAVWLGVWMQRRSHRRCFSGSSTVRCF